MSSETPFTAEQESKIAQLQELMTTHYHPLPESLRAYEHYFPRPDSAPTLCNPKRYFCVTFLQSREWDVAKAFAMMQEVVSYREATQADAQPAMPPAMSVRGWNSDEVRTTLQRPQRDTPQRIDRVCRSLAPYYTNGLHYWDREGRLVLYMLLGSADGDAVVRTLKQLAHIGQTPHDVLWEYVQHMNVVTEAVATYQLLKWNAASGTATEACSVKRAVTVVVDLEGFALGTLWSPAMDLYKSVQQESFRYYPDAVEKILVVNAPDAVMLIYNLVKPIMPDAFLKKVSIVKPKDTLAALTTAIEVEHIPAFLGGECTCEGKEGAGAGGCITGYRPHTEKKQERRQSQQQQQQQQQRRQSSTASGSSLSCRGGDDAYGGHDEVCTEDITLAAGREYVRAMTLQQGEVAHWDFAITPSAKSCVDFSVFAIPATSVASTDAFRQLTAQQRESYRRKSARAARVTDSYTADSKGATTVVLVWCDTTSWFASSNLQVQVYKTAGQCTESAATP